MESVSMSFLPNSVPNSAILHLEEPGSGGGLFLTGSPAWNLVIFTLMFKVTHAFAWSQRSVKFCDS